MPLRSDFKISAATPKGPAADTNRRTMFNDSVDSGWASQLNELVGEESRLLVAGKALQPARDIGESAQRGQQVPFETVSAIG